jgi:hypothetical protein
MGNSCGNPVVPIPPCPFAGANGFFDFRHREAAFGGVTQGVLGKSNGFHFIPLLRSIFANSTAAARLPSRPNPKMVEG